MEVISTDRPARIIGYARVSSKEQDLTLQLEELERAGCVKVYAEKASGAISDRKRLRHMLAAVEPGDTVIVTRLDRLARSTKDLLNTLDVISKRGGKFRSLHDTWADTTTPHGELMVTILGGLATFERHLIKARTEEGRKRAKEMGVRFGQPPKLTPDQTYEALKRIQDGESHYSIARSFNVHQSTITRFYHRWEAQREKDISDRGVGAQRLGS